nr:MAG TPA: hypothetical protein [Caudoviricetes sp.]
MNVKNSLVSRTKKIQKKNKLYTNSYTSYSQALAYLCI